MPTIEVSEHNLNEKVLQIAIDALNSKQVIIVPTDTVYAFVCLLSNRNGIEKICKITGKKPEKANLSLLCKDLKNISDFTLQFDKNIYKLMNRNLPGPVTFILNANNKVPKLFLNKKKTIGIRVPANKILQYILQQIDEPLVTASVHHPEDREIILESPLEMNNYYGNQIPIIVNAGNGSNISSAIVDCTSATPIITREGELPLN